jgi:hypothetical protein
MILGRDPGGEDVWSAGQRVDGVSASFVFRRFEDGVVARVPSPDDLRRFKERFPDGFVEILVQPGERLSDELQDDESYRYALVDLCAGDWEELHRKYAEAKLLLPFSFGPLGQAS